MTENEFDRTARLWLEDGPTELSDRALQAAFDDIHVTRQRRPWSPARGSTSMNNIMKVAVAATVVIVVAIAGINLIPASGPGGPPATPSPSPSPSPAAFEGQVRGELEPGTYVLRYVQPFRITFTVPAGWEKLAAPATIWVAPASNARLGFMTVENVFVDPCAPDAGLHDPPVGSKVGDLVTALDSLPGIKASAPTDVTVSGFAGQRIDLTALTAWDACVGEPKFLRVNAGTLDVPPPGPQDDYRLWILDVDGRRVVFAEVARAAATAADRSELQAIVESIRVELDVSASPNASGSPSP
jgi:hypothetical protein